MKFNTMIPWSESMETTFIPKTSYQEKPSNSYALIYLVSPSSLRFSKSYYKKKTISYSCFNWYGLCKTFRFSAFVSCTVSFYVSCSHGETYLVGASSILLCISCSSAFVGCEGHKIVDKWSPLVLTETLGCILIPCLTYVLILFIIGFHQSSSYKKD